MKNRKSITILLFSPLSIIDVSNNASGNKKGIAKKY